MRYWHWNIPNTRQPKTETKDNGSFDLAKALGFSAEDIEHAKKVAFSDKAPVVMAGEIELSNPWDNDKQGNILNDLQCWRRWDAKHLTRYINLAKEIV